MRGEEEILKEEGRGKKRAIKFVGAESRKWKDGNTRGTRSGRGQ